jgi:hypothetical protein
MQRMGIMQVSQSTLHLYILLAYNTYRGRKTCFGNIITLHSEYVIGGEQVYIHVYYGHSSQVGHYQKVNSAVITSPLAELGNSYSPLSTSTVVILNCLKRNNVKFEK